MLPPRARWTPSFVALGLVACSAPLPYVNSEQPVRGRAYREVEFPPPPPRPEAIPPRPSDRAVWLDGEWSWRRGRWAWVVGRWVEPPVPDASFRAWDACRCEDGSLLFAPGMWRDDTGRALAPPEPLVLANPSEGPVLSRGGERVEVGRNRRTRYMRRARRRFRREMRRRERDGETAVHRREECLRAAGRNVATTGSNAAGRP